MPGEIPGWSATMVFVLTRVTALVLVVPGFSLRVVPWRARLLLVALISVPVLCVVSPVSNLSTHALPPILFHELIVGLSLSLVPAAIVFGLQAAVQSLNGMTGLPGGTETGSAAGDLASASPLQRLLLATVLAIFFVSSGHRIVLQAVLDSFDWLPPGGYTSLETVSEVLLDLLSASFALGVRSMTPVAVSLAMGLMTLAAINRIVPQFGYFAVGMSVQSILLVGSLVLFVGGVVWYLENSFIDTPASFRLALQQALEQVSIR